MEQRGALIMIDGRNGIGHYVAAGATEAVSAVAQEFGVGSCWCAIAITLDLLATTQLSYRRTWSNWNCNFERSGLRRARGATKALLSNNPLAIAAPMGRNDAFLEMDSATSVTSRANVVDAAKSGMLLLAGLAQDAEGHPTRDPTAALAGSLRHIRR